MKIRMTADHNGFAKGEVLTISNDNPDNTQNTVDSGVADAFVNWARVAVWVSESPEPAEKMMDGPPKHKMLDRNAVKVK